MPTTKHNTWQHQRVKLPNSNAIFITRSVILFFFFNLQKVLLLRLGLFSILYLIFFEEKISNNANLFIYFRGYC
jgi:hypothetical protein